MFVLLLLTVRRIDRIEFKWWEEENVPPVLVITKISKTSKSANRLSSELQPKNKERKIENFSKQNVVNHFSKQKYFWNW